MKKKLILAVALAAVVGTVAIAGSEKEKVQIVHKGEVISVAPEAVNAHLAHGDQLYIETPPPPTEGSGSTDIAGGTGTIDLVSNETAEGINDETAP